MSATTDALAALVLPWAKTERPDAYAATLGVAGRPAAFLTYLVRLVELRYAADPAWRREAPLWALDLTALTATVRRGDARVLVAGRRVPDAPWRFAELALLHDATDFDLLAAAKTALDLTLVELHDDDG